jgi:hypothetical protein
VPDEEKLVDFTNRGEPIETHKELSAAKSNHEHSKKIGR